jgi:NAD(P)-dependent dehydrogenase (short-subunit alcohol dehydrogenase family)
MKRFEGKKVVITGAASGIGRATADRIAQEGGTVALMDINAEGVERAAKDIAAQYGVKALHYPMDVTNSAQVTETIGQAAKDLEGFDTLLHIAGALKTFHTHLMTDEEWHRIISINLHGTFYVNRASLPHLLANRFSAIVNMASTSAIGSHPWMAAYAASKGGVVSFTRALYIEYVRQGLRANCVIGGGIATPLHSEFKVPEGGDGKLLQGAIPFVKFVGPAHAASVVAFLASDDARYINGTEVRADGGALS